MRRHPAPGRDTMLKRFDFLKAAENRVSFFRRISTFFPTLDFRYQMILKAYDIAKDEFREKYREDGDRYFEHLRAVALILIDYLRIHDYRIIVAALLHDIVEDIPSWTIDRVRREFGDEIALMVEWLTKPSAKNFASKEERNRFYNKWLFDAPRNVIIIKLADKFHNMITLWACSKKKQLRKIAEAKEYYVPLAEKEIILIHELEAAIAELEAGLKKKK